MSSFQERMKAKALEAVGKKQISSQIIKPVEEITSQRPVREPKIKPEPFFDEELEESLLDQDHSTSNAFSWTDDHFELTKLLLKMSSRDVNRPDLNKFDEIILTQQFLLKDKKYWSYLVQKGVVQQTKDKQFKTIRENL